MRCRRRVRFMLRSRMRLCPWFGWLRRRRMRLGLWCGHRTGFRMGLRRPARIHMSCSCRVRFGPRFLGGRSARFLMRLLLCRRWMRLRPRRRSVCFSACLGLRRRWPRLCPRGSFVRFRCGVRLVFCGRSSRFRPRFRPCRLCRMTFRRHVRCPALWGCACRFSLGLRFRRSTLRWSSTCGRPRPCRLVRGKPPGS
jgi:hypothetical protein